MDIIFGPVPSRRLGRSLGINSIPPKTCSYGCAYCQVGPTCGTETELRSFFDPAEIRRRVEERVEAVRTGGETIDYLTFVPDGEPTLDVDLGRSIDALRPLGIPIAVISNGSLLWRPQVREALDRADWVSVKVDAVDRSIWRRVNAPSRRLDLVEVLEGIRVFAGGFNGTLVSETMLLEGVNDGDGPVEAVAAFLTDLDLDVAYLAVPTRPPNVTWARAPDEHALNRAFQIMSAVLPRVEYLIGSEGDAFCSTGDARSDLLSITAVHPMRDAAVRRLLETAGAGWGVVEELLDGGDLRAVEHRGETFFVHRIG